MASNQSYCVQSAWVWPTLCWPGASWLASGRSPWDRLAHLSLGVGLFGLLALAGSPGAFAQSQSETAGARPAGVPNRGFPSQQRPAVKVLPPDGITEAESTAGSLPVGRSQQILPSVNDRATTGGQDEFGQDHSQKQPIAFHSLFDVVSRGGWPLIPIAISSFVLLVFVFERAIVLRRSRVIAPPFVKRFFHQLKEGQLDRETALQVCQESNSPVAGVLAHAVRKWGRPAVEVEQAVLDSGERLGNHLRRHLRVINGVATVCPLLGLLGTVTGMIEALGAISTSQAMGRPELLASGISQALLSTAAGLCVAIPALILYMVFVGRVDRLMIEIDELGQELVDQISAEATTPPARSKSRRKAA